MKKIHIYIVLSMLIAGVFSCSDNEDVSGLHQLTADETAEIAHQEYIADSIRSHVSTDIVFTKAYSNDYASVTEDVQDIFCSAFDTTLYQIHQAINSGELKLYQGVVSDVDPTYTAELPGYWLKEDGTVGTSGEGLVWCSIGHSETELYLMGGNHPDNGVAGSSVSTVLIAALYGGEVTLNITFNIIEAGDEPVVATYNVDETYTTDYAATVTDVTDVLTDGLGLTAAEIGAAIDDQSLVFEGLNADGTVYLDDEGNPGQTANYPGHWYSLAGDVVSWGSESIFYSEFSAEGSTLVFNQGHHSDNAAVGQETTIKQVVKLNDKEVTFIFNLKIVE